MQQNENQQNEQIKKQTKMKTKILISILLAVCNIGAFAQFPKPEYYLKDSIFNFKDNAMSDWSIKNYQSYYMSFIGEYKQAIKTMDEIYDNTKKERLSLADSMAFVSNYKAVDATEYILKRAKNKKVIMINESHNMPQQRAYMISLLQKLYNQGFRYLGMEALGYDSLLNQRAYPLLGKGWLLTEPVMGNVAREAIKIGFKVFSYEIDHNEAVVPYNPENAFSSQVGTGLEREIRQAFNIMKIFKADSTAKVVLFAGLGHICREWDGYMMASYVWRFLGPGLKNRPLSIDQICMVERSSDSIENPYFLFANVDKPSVFADTSNSSFINEYTNKQIDIQVFHPRSKYINERPDWLYQLDRIPFYIDAKKHKIQYPLIVKAYCKGEDISKAVPFDVIQLNDKKEKKPLLLKKGFYTIELKGLKQSEFIEIEVIPK